MRRGLLLADILFVATAFFSFAFFPPDRVLLVSFGAAIAYLLATRRKNLSLHLFVATAMAAFWAILGKGEYGYNQPFLVVGGINAFALFGWALALFACYVLFSHGAHHYRVRGFGRRFLLFVVVFWPLMILAETLAYHAFGIRNLAAAAYPGLPICACIHAPPWMQALYFAMGPLYFFLCYVLRLERDPMDPR